ncbi:MAG: protein translocase subunit SecF [Alphaproteobacteria bacterium]|nr:protein translocase subunit SecF [Alphaproteobacteria bacterium]
MKPLRLIPHKTSFGFVRLRRILYAVSIAALIASAALFMVRGLNLGIDFLGGIMIEVETQGPADLGAMRATLGGLGLGEVAMQEFGAPNDVLIRVARQPGGEKEQMVAVDQVKKALGAMGIGEMNYRRVEFVGPKVSAELVEAGVTAIIAAVLLMLLYIWFRFEWQFSIGAVIALIHDVGLTIGMFALTQFEFNLASIAAILTIVGYSINDTVVVYDRVRENLRKYKAMPMADLADLSLNETLSRTVMTSVTTMLALLALYFFGGEVIEGFVFAMMFGVVVGTYSSIFIAVALLLDMKSHRDGRGKAEAEASPTS